MSEADSVKREPYTYTQEQARRYHQKVHDLTGRLEVAELEAKLARDRVERLDAWALKDIGTYVHTSVVDRHTYSLCLEYVARVRRRAWHRFPPKWLSALSVKLTGSHSFASGVWATYRAILSITRYVRDYRRHA